MKYELRNIHTKLQRSTERFSRLRMSTLLMVFFCLFATQTFAQKVTAKVDSTQIKIGEEIKFSLSVEADTTATIVFPEGKNIFLPLELLEAYDTDTVTQDAKYNLIKEYGITQFDSGTYYIPKLKILINEKPFFTDSIRVAVADVAVDTLKQKMFNIKKITAVDKGSSNWWIYLLIVLGLIALFGAYFYFFVFQLKEKKAKKKKAEIPPYDRALLQLNELDKSRLLLNSEYKGYYSELTNIVRQYIEEEVRIDALESTTAELIRKIEAQKDAGYLDLKDETIKNLKNVLQTADLVKFAKSKPDDAVVKADRNLVENIVVETKEAIPEISEEELRKDEEYKLKLIEEQRKKQRFRNTVIGVVAMIIAFGGLIGYATLEYVKENTYVGHSMGDLLEDEWIAPFSIDLAVTTFKQKPEITLNDIAEKILKKFEDDGATNLLVFQDEYESPTGIEGIKIHGSGIFVDTLSPFSSTQERDYEVYIFQEGRGVQTLTMMYAEADEDGKKLVDRILSSIALIEKNTNDR